MDQTAPRDVTDLCELIQAASRTSGKIALVGADSKTCLGAPIDVQKVSLIGLNGVVDYDPAELVLTVRPGSSLKDVTALLAENGQMLAFEPFDLAAATKGQTDRATIGGTMAAGISGSRRITAGAARDHLLGAKLINGRGELIVAGAKVVKNVTGFDLPKLVCGSWGRVGAITELSIKVLPRPTIQQTYAAQGLTAHQAHTAMAVALGSCAGVAAAAHLQSGVTLFRVEGFGSSVKSRAQSLHTALHGTCSLEALDEAGATDCWDQAKLGLGLAGAARWCVHIAARNAAELIDRLQPFSPQWSMDWGGTRVWIALDAAEPVVRSTAIELGGEATLISGPAAMRRTVPALHPRPASIAKLERTVRQAFDPGGVFDTGRFTEVVNAD
jgi:glycolate oxidase FAD binding subunit